MSVEPDDHERKKPVLEWRWVWGLLLQIAIAVSPASAPEKKQ